MAQILMHLLHIIHALRAFLSIFLIYVDEVSTRRGHVALKCVEDQITCSYYCHDQEEKEHQFISKAHVKSCVFWIWFHASKFKVQTYVLH